MEGHVPKESCGRASGITTDRNWVHRRSVSPRGLAGRWRPRRGLRSACQPRCQPPRRRSGRLAGPGAKHWVSRLPCRLVGRVRSPLKDLNVTHAAARLNVSPTSAHPERSGLYVAAEAGASLR